MRDIFFLLSAWRLGGELGVIVSDPCTSEDPFDLKRCAGRYVVRMMLDAISCPHHNSSALSKYSTVDMKEAI